MPLTYQMRGGLFLLLLVLQLTARGQSLLHYWNFNNNSSLVALTAPLQGAVAGAAITAIPGGISAIDVAGGTGQNFNVENINARNGDEAGTHLRFNDPIGGQLQFDLPTTGFENIIVRFATRRSGSGAGTQLWSYTIDGSNYLPFATVLPNNSNPALATLDFSGLAEVNDNSATAAANAVTLVYAAPFAAGINYNLLIENVVGCPYVFSFAFNTTVSFASTFTKVNEAAGTLDFVINVASPAVSSVELVVKPAPFSTADSNDVGLLSQTLQFDGSSPLTRTISIPIIDDAVAEQQAEYLVLSLENPVGLTINGNLDSDPQFEEINCVGTRSFFIFNTATQQIVYDSGDDFERFTAANYPSIFNADHESNTPKVRSRAKGPEPEGVTLATIAGQTFAFVALERIGGVMVYNITQPDSPVFVDYKNSRSTSAYAGDHGAEGIIYIEPTASPTGTPYILVSNEISGTITIFAVDASALATEETAVNAPRPFVAFPNPAARETVYFNRMADIQVFDNSGRLVYQAAGALTLDTSGFRSGVYFIKTAEGLVAKLVVI